MALYLMRHGDSDTNDPKQPLSKKGVEDTKRIGALLKSNSVRIDLIFHSPKLRAKQTAQIISQAFNPHIRMQEYENLKPNDTIEPILEEIPDWEENVMLVSHLPFLEKLLSKLLFGKERPIPFDLAASSVFCLEQNQPSMLISWALTPKLFGVMP